MKRSILFFFLVAIVATGAAQPTTTASPTKSDYLAKARKQNTAAWVLLSGGFAVTTTGVFVSIGETTEMIGDIFSEEQDKKHNAGGALLVSGGVLMLSSIPFFIASSNNKQKAATAFVKMEDQFTVRRSSFSKTSFPVVGIRIQL